jgi:hypothetical protein
MITYLLWLGKLGSYSAAIAPILFVLSLLVLREFRIARAVTTNII